jgi:formylglycine-generating enzyme required for sulfatase activity
MLLIPAGSFTMGSANGQADERPPHPVTLTDFFIDETEVTNAAYRECVAAGNCTPPQVTSSTTRANYFTRPEFANFPIIQVTWQQAVDYCTFRGKRLPTEAEWEYAARGDTNRVFPWGDEFELARVPARVPDTVEVGTLDNASVFGVKDMAGNAGEWVADWYAADFYVSSPANNPGGPETGRLKVYRGGSFDNPDGIFYTTTRRYKQGPGFRDVDIGFRCAADVP